MEKTNHGCVFDWPQWRILKLWLRHRRSVLCCTHHGKPKKACKIKTKVKKKRIISKMERVCLNDTSPRSHFILKHCTNHQYYNRNRELHPSFQTWPVQRQIKRSLGVWKNQTLNILKGWDANQRMKLHGFKWTTVLRLKLTIRRANLAVSMTAQLRVLWTLTFYPACALKRWPSPGSIKRKVSWGQMVMTLSGYATAPYQPPPRSIQASFILIRAAHLPGARGDAASG